MSDRNFVADAFNKHFDRIEKVIAFNPEYKNGTGYLDGAVTAPLEQGEVAKMMDDFGRRCILVGTLFGTVVIFQRFKGSDDTFVCNYPSQLSTFGLHLVGNHITSERDIHHLFGTFEYNVGEKIQNLLKTPEAIAAVKEGIAQRVISKF